MKKILVPTDLSETAELGLKLAVQIALRCQGSINLVNFTRHPPGKTFGNSGEMNLENSEEQVFTLEMLQAKRARLETLAAQYASSGVPIDFTVIDDKFKSGIDAYTSQENTDLIVMGTSGEETFGEAFTGNHTEQAIKMSSCPVLSVRDGFTIDDFQNIVAAVCVITDNQVALGLNELRDLADCFDAHIHLVHVRDKQRDANLILHEYFTKMASIAGLKKYSVVILDGDDVSETILAYADQIEAGLVAVLKNSPDGIFRIFSKKVSNRLVKEEGRPVLTLNLQNND